MKPRPWGYWTKGKLDILERYLDAFTTTTKNRATERIYIDAFAGQAENIQRETGEALRGSAPIALSISNPPFTRLHFFEMGSKASELGDALEAQFPGRHFEVHEGDCNQSIPKVLAQLKPLNWAPTFAFVDPNAVEVDWSTLKALALFKKQGTTKTEMWLLFSPSQFARLLVLDEGQTIRDQDAARVTAIFGNETWRSIYEARRSGKIDGAQARLEYLNLMRWQLEDGLGYKWTHPIEIFSDRGTPLYYMIFATDHPVGTKIMSNLYAEAAVEFPRMRKAVRELRRKQHDEEIGLQSLFTDEELGPMGEEDPIPNEAFYEYIPPERPWFLGEFGIE